MIAAAAAVAGVAFGAFIYQNTNVRNIYRTRTQGEKLRVRYEKDYKQYQRDPRPMITAVSLRVNLDPAKSSVRVHGHYDIANKFDKPIEQVLVTIPEEIKINNLRFTPGATMVKRDRPIDLDIWHMTTPWPAGTTGGLDFDLEWEPHGFPNGGPPTTVVENGTFLNSEMLPHFGYQEHTEIEEDDTRRKYGLKPKQRVADINDMAARRFNYMLPDADWVDFDAVISTSADQIAIAPGELVGEWKEAGRRLFHYRTRGKILGFFSVLSARYQVKQDRWNDVDIGIYYHPGHEHNLAKMIKGIKQTLDYCTRNFSPYQNKTVRIVEFPRYESFAHPSRRPFLTRRASASSRAWITPMRKMSITRSTSPRMRWRTSGGRTRWWAATSRAPLC